MGNNLGFDASMLSGPGTKGDITKELVFLGNHLASNTWA